MVIALAALPAFTRRAAVSLPQVPQAFALGVHLLIAGRAAFATVHEVLVDGPDDSPTVLCHCAGPLCSSVMPNIGDDGTEKQVIIRSNDAVKGRGVYAGNIPPLGACQKGFAETDLLSSKSGLLGYNTRTYEST